MEKRKAKQPGEDATTGTSSLANQQSLPNKEFVFEKRVFLGDTNAEGNVYFTRFFEWQGESREEFFRQHVPEHMEILQAGVRLITVNAWTVYKRSAFLFDEILIKVNTAHLKQFSLELVFTVTHKVSGNVLSYGGQKLAFADTSGKQIPIPAQIRERAKNFLIDSAPESEEIYETMQHAKHGGNPGAP